MTRKPKRGEVVRYPGGHTAVVSEWEYLPVKDWLRVTFRCGTTWSGTLDGFWRAYEPTDPNVIEQPQMPTLPGWTCVAASMCWHYRSDKTGRVLSVMQEEVDEYGPEMAVLRRFAWEQEPEALEVGTVNDNPRKQRAELKAMLDRADEQQGFVNNLINVRKAKAPEHEGTRIDSVPEAKRPQVCCQGDWLDDWEGEDA